MNRTGRRLGVASAAALLLLVGPAGGQGRAVARMAAHRGEQMASPRGVDPRTFLPSLGPFGGSPGLQALPAGAAGSTASSWCAPWAAVMARGASASDNRIFGTSASGANDAWAVGYWMEGYDSPPHPVAVHWDGVAGRNVAVPTGPGDGSPESALLGVADLAPGDVWAVGYRYEAPTQSYRTLVEHWNGKAWKVVPSADPSASSNALYAVTFLSPTDGWAAGFNANPSVGFTRPLVEHWDGTTWTAMPQDAIAPGFDYQLSGVVATGPGDVWAVGQRIGPARFFPFAERWDGQRWTETPWPSADQGKLTGIAAGMLQGQPDVWAAGYSFDQGGVRRPLMARWTQTGWQTTPAPAPSDINNEIDAIAWISADEVWTVGDYYDPPTDSFEPLTERWDGTAWSIVASPAMPPRAAGLFAVSAVPGSSSVLAAGFAIDTELVAFQPLFETYAPGANLCLTMNGAPDPVLADSALTYSLRVRDGGPDGAGGTRLRVALPPEAIPGGATPSQGTCSGGPIVRCDLGTLAPGAEATVSIGVTPFVPGPLLASASVTSARPDPAPQDDAVSFVASVAPQWRVTYVALGGDGFLPGSVRVAVGDTVQWNVTGRSGHGPVDRTGMNLYGWPAVPGPFYRSRAFTAAGTYPVADAGSAATGTVAVSMRAAPASGGAGSRFTLTFASAPAGAGFVYDVQIRRPGATGWAGWATGVTAGSARFTPDAGPGRYLFRARLRSSRGSGAATAGWSPAAAVRVTPSGRL